jgi:hypothetical protein
MWVSQLYEADSQYICSGIKGSLLCLALRSDRFFSTKPQRKRRNVASTEEGEPCLERRLKVVLYSTFVIAQKRRKYSRKEIENKLELS